MRARCSDRDADRPGDRPDSGDQCERAEQREHARQADARQMRVTTANAIARTPPQRLTIPDASERALALLYPCFQFMSSPFS